MPARRGAAWRGASRRRRDRRRSGGATWWDAAVDSYVTRCGGGRQAGLGATRLCERTDQSSREPRNELPRARASLLCFSSLSVPSSSTLSVYLSFSLRCSLLLSLYLLISSHSIRERVAPHVAASFFPRRSRVYLACVLHSSFSSSTRTFVPRPSTRRVELPLFALPAFYASSSLLRLLSPAATSVSVVYIRRLHARLLARARDARTTRLAGRRGAPSASESGRERGTRCAARALTGPDHREYHLPDAADAH